MESFLQAAACRAADSAPHPTTWTARAIAIAAAAHPRLGASAPQSLQAVAANGDLLLAIMKNISIVVPDDAPTLATALRRAVPWQRVVLRSGEHLVSSKDAGDPGSSVLRISSPVRICGEANTICRGTLVLESSCAGGSVSDLRLDDGGDCCIRCEGGAWQLSRLRLRCSHGAALLACGDARIRIDDCVLGGEGAHELGAHVELSAYGSVQVHGLAKRACYGFVLRDESSVIAQVCVLRQCSEAAVLVAHRGRAQLFGCVITECPAAAFMSGQGRGRLLELSGCSLEGISQRRLWADADRPRAYIWGEHNQMVRGLLRRDAEEGTDDDGESGDESGDRDSGSENEDARGIVRSRRPRGAGQESDSSDTDSLQDMEEFVDMEKLMAELDDVALHEAQQLAAGAAAHA